MRDLLWSALLGGLIGLVALAYVISFRRLRRFVVQLGWPHWVKLAMGGGDYRGLRFAFSVGVSGDNDAAWTELRSGE